MRQHPRVRVPRVVLALVIVGLLISGPVYPSGFQVMTQGARAMGMGLAFSGVANDPSAIFYNPAGLGWQTHFETLAGGSILHRSKGDFQGANPYPGEGTIEHEQKQTFLLPYLYAVVPLTPDLNFGLGIFAPYGLGFRWENPEEFSGRFISQNAVIQSTDINPVFSFRLLPQLSIAAGADLRFSKVQLERNQVGFNIFTESFVDVAHVKLNSDLLENSGWGWNAGIMVKPFEGLSFGVAYRSKIKVDYEGTATFIQRLTNTPFDALVAQQLPQGEHPVTTTIEFPGSLNIGAGIGLPADFLLALEADWTQWSKFDRLDIVFPDLTGRDLTRLTNWEDSWAYRAGLEKKLGAWAVRVGYYFDNTPQPERDVGPLLADSDRDAYTAGFGYNTERFGVDIGGVYIKFKDREVLTESTDEFFGRYQESAYVVGANLRLAF